MRDIRRRDVYRCASPREHIYIRGEETEKDFQIKTKKVSLPNFFSKKGAVLLSIAVFYFFVLIPVFQSIFPEAGYLYNDLSIKAFEQDKVLKTVSQQNFSENISIAQAVSSSEEVIKTTNNDLKSASQVKVAMTRRSNFSDGSDLNVPDYVFEEDYKLRSIEELKDYIAQNRHLPGVASRDEIKKFGIDFGSMMMSILEKTEENTIYIINNSEDIKKHKNAIENLLGKSLTLEERVDLVIRNVSNKDSLISKISSKIDSLEAKQDEAEDNFKNIQDQLDMIEKQNQAVIDFALVLDTKNLIFKDSLGNINLGKGRITAEDLEVLNKLKAKDIETNTLKMEENKTSGKGVIKAGFNETLIETEEASKTAKIYLTLTSSSGERTLYIPEIETIEGKSFKVKFEGEPALMNISFNWLIIK